MLRFRKYQGQVNRLLKDERISPNRRMLVFLLQIYEDAKAANDTKEADRIWSLISTQFGPYVGKIDWVDKEDKSDGFDKTKVEVEAAKEIKDLYVSLGREKDGNSNSGNSAASKPASAGAASNADSTN